MDKEMMKGSIDILLLSELNRHDSYGYEIVKNLKQRSNDLYDMSEGTLYPALKRLEKKEFVESYWGKLTMVVEENIIELLKAARLNSL